MLSKLQSMVTRDNHQKLLSLVVVVVLAVAGITAIIFAVTKQLSAPQPAKSAYGRLSMPGNTGPEPSTPVLPYAQPIALNIPAIKVQASLITVGKNPDGSIEVPTAPHINSPAWYKYSPAPGEYGASIIEGHVDNYYTGASVFFNLGKLKPGDKIMVQRKDGITATFKVNAVREYPKTSFPTAEVYKPTANGAELHLVTCGGMFDNATGHYLSNTVVFSTLNGYSQN